MSTSCSGAKALAEVQRCYNSWEEVGSCRKVSRLIAS